MAGGYHTFVSGQVLTAAELDAFVRDQLVTQEATVAARDAAITVPVEGMVATTADRDIIWCYDGSAWQRVVAYSATGRTGCQVKRVASQSVANSTLTTVTFDTASIDNDAWHSGATFTQISVPTGLSGFYALGLNWAWSAGPGGAQRAVMTLNGSDQELPLNAAASAATVVFSGINVPLVSGNTLGFKFNQNSGGALNLTVTLDLWRLMV